MVQIHLWSNIIFFSFFSFTEVLDKVNKKSDVSLTEFEILLEALDARYLYFGLKKLTFLFYCNFYFFYIVSRQKKNLNFFNSSNYVFLPKKKKNFLTIRGPHVHSRSKDTFLLFFYKGFFKINFMNQLTRLKVSRLLHSFFFKLLNSNQCYLRFCDLKVKKNFLITTYFNNKVNTKIFSEVELNILKKNWCQY